MTKKVLAVYYSQSGQLEEIVENFTASFNDSEIILEKVKIRPKNEFLFPWSSARFFDAMPESVMEKPVELEPFRLQQDFYDLIIFAYQPWFLSPSIPATSIFQDPYFKKILKNTNVVTLIGARNMWLNAQEKIKKNLSENGAHLAGNVVLIDRNSNLISAVTILYWMLTGKKDRYKGVFPKPGIAEKDIKVALEFGSIVKETLNKGNWQNLQNDLVKSHAVAVDADLMFIEERAGRLFSLWANFILKRKNRSFWLIVYKYYLLLALFIVAPLVLAVNRILFRPFFQSKINKKKKYYLGLN